MAKALRRKQFIKTADVSPDPLASGKKRGDAKQATAAKKNRRSLDEIAHDIRASERKSIFEIGSLLIEAKESHPGEFLEWLGNSEFDFSEDTAENYMHTARLAKANPNVFGIRVPMRVIYDLDLNDKNLSLKIDALAKACKRTSLSQEDAESVIALVEHRQLFGDYPDATLRALWDLFDDGQDPHDPKSITARVAQDPERLLNEHPEWAWKVQAGEILRREKPETYAAANRIIYDHNLEDVANLYAPHGALPPLVQDANSLFYLEKDVEPNRRAEVLHALIAAAAGELLTAAEVRSAIYAAPEPDQTIIPPSNTPGKPAAPSKPPTIEATAEKDDREQPKQAEQPPPDPEEEELPKELVEFIIGLVSYARRRRPQTSRGIAATDLNEAKQLLDHLCDLKSREQAEQANRWVELS